MCGDSYVSKLQMNTGNLKQYNKINENRKSYNLKADMIFNCFRL